MSSLSQFGSGDYTAGQIRLFNPKEDTTGYLPAKSSVSKTTYANLYSKLTTKDPMLAQDAVDVTTYAPDNNSPIAVYSTELANGTKPIWTGTYYVICSNKSGATQLSKIYYSTSLAGPWSEIRQVLHSENYGQISSVEWIAAQNKLLITRQNLISYIDFASAPTIATEETVITYYTATLGATYNGAASWNASLSKVVFIDSLGTYTSVAPVIKAVALDGTGLVTFTGLLATHELQGLRCIGNITYVFLSTSRTGSAIFTAGSGSTALASVTTAAALPYGTGIIGDGCAGIETDGTNVIIGYTSTTGVFNYYYFNGTTWTHVVGSISYSAVSASSRVIYDGVRWYIQSNHMGIMTSNFPACAYIPALGSAVATAVSLSSKMAVATNKIKLLGMCNGKLLFTFANNIFTTCAVLLSSSNQLSTYTTESVHLGNGPMYTGYNPATSKFYIMYWHPNLYVSGGVSYYSGFSLFTSTNGITYTQEYQVTTGAQYTAPELEAGATGYNGISDCGKIKFSGINNAWVCINLNLSTSYYPAIFSTNNAFTSMTFAVGSAEPRGSYGHINNCCLSTTDGTYIYFVGSSFTFNATDTVTGPNGIQIYKCLISTGAVTVCSRILAASTIVASSYDTGAGMACGTYDNTAVNGNKHVLFYSSVSGKCYWFFNIVQGTGPATYYPGYCAFNSAGIIGALNFPLLSGSPQYLQPISNFIDTPFYDSVDKTIKYYPKLDYYYSPTNYGFVSLTIDDASGKLANYTLRKAFLSNNITPIGYNPIGVIYETDTGASGIIYKYNTQRDWANAAYSATVSPGLYGIATLPAKNNMETIDANNCIVWDTSGAGTFYKLTNNTANFVVPTTPVTTTYMATPYSLSVYIKS